MDRDDSTRTLRDWLKVDRRDVALVFADIVKSLEFLIGKGTNVFGRSLDAYRARAHQLAADWEGRVVTDTGDEIFAVFLTPGNACRFARAMFDDSGDPLITARIGVHFGSVLWHDSRLIGRAVAIASRVMDHGERHEFWMSDTAKQALEADSPALAGEIAWITSEECLLDGVPEPQLLWRAA